MRLLQRQLPDYEGCFGRYQSCRHPEAAKWREEHGAQLERYLEEHYEDFASIFCAAANSFGCGADWRQRYEARLEAYENAVKEYKKPIGEIADDHFKPIPYDVVSKKAAAYRFTSAPVAAPVASSTTTTPATLSPTNSQLS